MWVVADPGDVREVLLDPEVFRPDNAVLAHTPLSVRALRILSSVGFALPPTLANNGGPSHRAIRACVARFFSPVRVAAAEPLARALMEQRLTAVRRELDAGADVDLVAAVAAEVPALVVLDLLGLDDVGVPALKRWSLDSLELFWGWPDADRQLELARTAAEFYAWLRTRVEAVRRARGTDLFSALVDLGLTDEECCAVGYFLLIAGQETTTQLISAAYHRLIGDPARWRTLDAAAEVELALAEISSVPTWRRVTAEPAAVGEVKLPGGAPVLLELTGTDGAADLAFGIGIHRCLGAGLARLETRIALELAAHALPDVVLVEPEPPMIDLLSFRAPARVLVRASPAAA